MNFIKYNPDWIDIIILFLVFIPIVIVDIKEKKIPDFFIFLGMAALVLKRLLVSTPYLLYTLLAAAIGFALIWIFWFFSKGKIGLGDAKLSGLIAMTLGLFGWFLTLFFASVSGILWILALVSLKRMNFKQKIPFAPFFGLGVLLAYILQDILYCCIVSLLCI